VKDKAISIYYLKNLPLIADKYRMPPVKLEEDAVQLLVNYRWPGNIRQLKNIAEQISVIEEKRLISKNTLLKYLPNAVDGMNLPVPILGNSQSFSSGTMDSKEKELLYKVIFDMKKEINELRQMVLGNVQNTGVLEVNQAVQHNNEFSTAYPIQQNENAIIHQVEEVEESLSLADKEKEFIIKALEKHRNKRKNAAKELGISERTLYRKIKEYDIQ